jgi:hypothetical protein
MALYTLIFTFRRHTRSFQVRAGSATEAIRTWAEQLEALQVRDFGHLSKGRIAEALERMGINATPGLVNVYQWSGAISSYWTELHIVATDDTPTL